MISCISICKSLILIYRWIGLLIPQKIVQLIFYGRRNRVYYGKTLHDKQHWSRVTHICVGKLTIIGSNNGLSRGRRQAIIWTSDGILFIGPLETNVSEIVIENKCIHWKNVFENVCEMFSISSRRQYVTIMITMIYCILEINSWMHRYHNSAVFGLECKPIYSLKHNPAFTVFIHYCNSNKSEISSDKQLKHSLWVIELTLSMFTGILFHTTSCPKNVTRPCTYGLWWFVSWWRDVHNLACKLGRST